MSADDGDDGGAHGADEELMEWNDGDGLEGHDGVVVTTPRDGSGDLEG